MKLLHNNNIIPLYKFSTVNLRENMEFYNLVYGKGGIYAWVNKITDDLYIGRSLNLRKRALSYLSKSYKKYNSSTKVVQNMQLYGINNFEFCVLKEFNKSEFNLILQSEKFYLETLKPSLNSQLQINKLTSTTTNSRKHKFPYIQRSFNMKSNRNHFKTHSEFSKNLLSLHALNRIKPIRPSVVVEWTDLLDQNNDNYNNNVQVSLSMHRLAKDLQLSRSTLIKGLKNGKTLFKNRYQILTVTHTDHKSN